MSAFSPEVCDLEKAIKTNPKVALEIARCSIHKNRFLVDFVQMLNEKRIKSILEIGAGDGDFMVNILGFTEYRGNIMSYEPNPQLFETLKSRAMFYQEWDIYNSAAFSSKKIVPLYYNPDAPKSGSISPANVNGLEKTNVKALDIMDIFNSFYNPNINSGLILKACGTEGVILERLGEKNIRKFFFVLLRHSIYDNVKNSILATNKLLKAGFAPVDQLPTTPLSSGINQECEILYFNLDSI